MVQARCFLKSLYLDHILILFLEKALEKYACYRPDKVLNLKYFLYIPSETFEQPSLTLTSPKINRTTQYQKKWNSPLNFKG